jgi:hypothetical protein
MTKFKFERLNNKEGSKEIVKSLTELYTAA